MKYLLLLLTVFILTACGNSKKGSGNIITENRSVAAFKEISASGSIEIEISKSETQSITITTDDNIMPYVETIVKDGKLKVRLKDIDNLRNSNINIKISVPTLTHIQTSASAEISSRDIITSTDKFELDASSGSEINVTVDAPTVDAAVSSGAEIIAAGRAKAVKTKASSGATLDFLNLKAETADAEASSGASIKVFSSININASASSGGEVNYTGGAAQVKKNESSGGSVSAQ